MPKRVEAPTPSGVSAAAAQPPANLPPPLPPLALPEQPAAQPAFTAPPAAPDVAAAAVAPPSPQFTSPVAAQPPAVVAAASPVAGPSFTPPAPGAAADMGLAGLMAGGGAGVSLGAVDLGGVEEQNFALLPLGAWIEAEIKGVKMQPGKSDPTTTNMEVRLSTTFPEGSTGVSLKDTVSFKDTALWKFKSLARACDLLSPDGARYIGDAQGKDFIGNIVRFQVQHDNYNGSLRNKIATGYQAGFQTPGITG